MRSLATREKGLTIDVVKLSSLKLRADILEAAEIHKLSGIIFPARAIVHKTKHQ